MDGIEDRPAYPLVQPSVAGERLLNSIRIEELESVMFTDSLKTLAEYERKVGEFTISVENVYREGDGDCFLVRADSYGSVDDVPCGTSVTSYVSKHLVTLEQQYREYINIPDQSVDRVTSWKTRGNETVISQTVTQAGATTTSETTYPATPILISEGANFLLQRILVKRGLSTLEDGLLLLCMDTNGKLANSRYRAISPRTQTVEGQELTVAGLERTVVPATGMDVVWFSHFLESGHLVSRVQVGSPVSMVMTKLPVLPLELQIPTKQSFDKRDLDWQDDMELSSKFQSRREELRDEHTTYLCHNDDIKAMLFDFLQTVIVHKPQNVIQFAAEHFSSLSMDVPQKRSFPHTGQLLREDTSV